MNIIAIIQARMASTRLPGKVLLDVGGEPMLARVFERTRRASRLTDVRVATSNLAVDDPIAVLCTERDWPCFRGSEPDVLERYLGAARAAQADVVVRITGDCPLIDPAVIDRVLGEFLRRRPEVDYASNVHPRRTFPRGLDCEVLSARALEQCGREAHDSASREHVTPYIYRHPELFAIHSVYEPDDHGHLRWTVDTPEDLELVRRIYRHFGHDQFTWRDVLGALAQHPGWSEINRHIDQKVIG